MILKMHSWSHIECWRPKITLSLNFGSFYISHFMYSFLFASSGRHSYTRSHIFGASNSRSVNWSGNI